MKLLSFGSTFLGIMEKKPIIWDRFSVIFSENILLANIKRSYKIHGKVVNAPDCKDADLEITSR